MAKKPAPKKKATIRKAPPKKKLPGSRQQAAREKLAARAKRPQQQKLIDDIGIKALDDVGASYASIRDQRQELTREEHDLKVLAKTLMHKHGKTIYRHGTLEIVLTPGDEEIKVKIRPEPPIEIQEATTDNPSASATETFVDGEDRIADQEPGA